MECVLEALVGAQVVVFGAAVEYEAPAGIGERSDGEQVGLTQIGTNSRSP